MAAAFALEDAKKRAAAQALELIAPGMRLGLGTGSTASQFVTLLGARVAGGLAVTCVPTSERTAALAASFGISLSTLDETPELDLTVDGADEFDPALRLIKGGGGALMREKIVAAASQRFVVITDASKAVDVLGRFPLPVEVVPFGLEATRRKVERAVEQTGSAGELVLRRTPDGHAFVTDGGHFIVDCHLGRIADPDRLAVALSLIPGVVEHGLFIGLASAVICAGADGITSLGRLG